MLVKHVNRSLSILPAVQLKQESQERANHSLPLRTQRQQGQEEKQDLNNQQPRVAGGKGNPELEARAVTVA